MPSPMTPAKPCTVSSPTACNGGRVHARRPRSGQRARPALSPVDGHSRRLSSLVRTSCRQRTVCQNLHVMHRWHPADAGVCAVHHNCFILSVATENMLLLLLLMHQLWVPLAHPLLPKAGCTSSDSWSVRSVLMLLMISAAFVGVRASSPASSSRGSAQARTVEPEPLLLQLQAALPDRSVLTRRLLVIWCVTSSVLLNLYLLWSLGGIKI